MNSNRNRTLLGIFTILALTLLSYGPALTGGFIWDDDDYVWENDTLDAPDALAQIWDPKPGEISQLATPQYYPVVFTTFWIENQLWGRGHEDTLGYHIVNVLLHALSALLIWRILSLLGVRHAWVVATAFAVHPVHVESVAWITERKNVLSGVFYLSALLAYLRFLRPESLTPPPETPPPAENLTKKQKRKARVASAQEVVSPDWKFYLLALLCFGCALLSKSVTASLPAAILLILYWKRGKLTSGDVLPLLPLFLIGYLSGSHTAAVEAEKVFKLDVDLGVHGLGHLLVAGRAIWFYANKLLLPIELTFMYPRWALDTGSILQWLFPLSALLVLGLAWKNQERFGRGLLVALLFFGGTLIPALGFVNVYPMYYSYVADHFQYLASLGILTLVLGGGLSLLANGLSPKIANITAAGVLVLLSFGTWNQTQDYRDLRTLWQATLERNPGALMAAINLSNMVLDEDKDVEEANAILETALAQVPEGVHRTIHARAHYNHANNLTRLDRLEEAIDEYERTLEIDPEYSNALYALGLAHERMRRFDEAIEWYDRYLAWLNSIGREDPKVRERMNALKANRR